MFGEQGLIDLIYYLMFLGVGDLGIKFFIIFGLDKFKTQFYD